MDETDNGRQDWMRSTLERFEGRLIRYAHRLTGDAERARDVVQETFLKLCREDPATLNGRLAQWLYTVCRNQALDIRRKESRMAVVADEVFVEVDLHQPDPGELAERNESLAAVLELLDRLPGRQQECIRLKFQHSLSYREIAAVTGLTVSNVGFVIHAGMTTLRTKMRRDD